ncbi:MAG: hypothetical protein WKG07_12925 [Hymenobacter sp.]
MRPRSLSACGPPSLTALPTGWPGKPGAAQGAPEFASRATYGRYLAEELAAALAAPATNGVHLRHYPTEALAATLLLSMACRQPPRPTAAPWPATPRCRRLASAALPPPTGPDHRYLHHPGYHADPGHRARWPVLALMNQCCSSGLGLRP